MVKIKGTSISPTQWYPPPGKNSVVCYKDSWGIVVNACVNYQKQIFIGVGRYKSGRTTFSKNLSIKANTNSDKSAILNLILTSLHRIHWRIVINSCVKYRKKIFIGVGDMHPDGQNWR